MIGAAPRIPDSYQQITTQLNRTTANIVDTSFLSGGLPNAGKQPLPHVLTFNSLLGSIARVYRDSDEAIKASRDNARFMRNDVGIMECLEARQRLTALLDWHIEPEDENSPEQKELCTKLTMILKRMRRFTEYRRNLLEAIWYGKYAVQHRWAKQRIQGESYIMPTAPTLAEGYGWNPVNGDKLVFQHDDPSWLSGTYNRDLGPVGILINRALAASSHIDKNYLAATDRGMAYFLPHYQRRLLAIHRHQIEDAPWENPIDAGSVHGVGIRSRIYWEWFQQQECKAYLLEYLERSAAGIEVWEYPMGSSEAKDAVETAALQRGSGNKGVILFPKPMGEDAPLYNVHIVEPGMAGAEIIKNLLEEYFGHRIKRYILGQTLTSEADATGLGSGLADLHLDTLMQIVTYDARNLEETLTYELVEPVKQFNFPAASDIHCRFVIETEDPNPESKLGAFKGAWEMGARIKESDVLDSIGASVPKETDRVLPSPQGGGEGMPGMDDGTAGGGAMPDPRTLAAVADMGAKVGAVVEPEKYERDDEPERGDFDVTAPEVVEKLRKIAEDFAGTLAIDRDQVTDIVIAGSAANPDRFTEQSDIDVHLVVDPEIEGIDREFLDEYLYDHGALWNLKHDVRIGGHQVELFVELEDGGGTPGARYSLVSEEWVQESEDDDDGEADAAVVDYKADVAERCIELCIQRRNHEQLKTLLQRLQAKRREGIAEDGETSVENEVYRELRHRGVLDELRAAIIQTYDESVSLDLDGDADQDSEHYARDVATACREAAAVTDTSPTEAQAKSGNYRKGKFWNHGLQVTIENPKGSTRSGTDANGKEWSVTMPAHYGYLRRTEGNDGDQLDVFIGPDPACDLVYVVDQINQDNGRFDEHKVMTGFHTEAEARKAYRDAFTAGWKVGTVTPATWKQLIDWMTNGDLSLPFAEGLS